MASITFRLRSSNYVGAINMSGKVISVREVQSAVAEKLKAPEEEIRVFMPDSEDLLHPDEDLLAYSVIDVVRQSHTGRLTYASSKSHRSATDHSASAGGPHAGSGGGAVSGGHADGLSEEERLAQLQAEVSFDTGIDQVQSGRFRRGGGPGGGGGFFGGRGRGGGPGGPGGGGGGGFNPFDAEHFRPPPRSYICHNCGKSGHYIQHCPAVKANGGKHVRLLAPPTGIPESMLVECTMDDPAPKFITRDQRLVKRRMDSAAFATVALPAVAAPDPGPVSQPPPNNEREGECVSGTGGESPRAAESSTTEDGGAKVPDALRCVVDKVLAVAALRAPCCGRLICQSCFDGLVQEAMRAMDDVNAEPVSCPACEEPLMIDSFEPATKEREQIAALASSRKRARE